MNASKNLDRQDATMLQCIVDTGPSSYGSNVFLGNRERVVVDSS